jgi:hypothetical protein
MRGVYLYYSDGKNGYPDSREGTLAFMHSNPAPDGRYCVPLNAVLSTLGKAVAKGLDAKSLKEAGCDSVQLKLATFSAWELKMAGFAARELISACFTAGELVSSVDEQTSFFQQPLGNVL